MLSLGVLQVLSLLETGRTTAGDDEAANGSWQQR